MAESGVMTDGVVTKFSDGVLAIKDDNSHSLIVTLEEGNFTADVSNSFVWHKERGVLDHRRAAEQEPVTISFTAKFVNWYSSTANTPSIYEALTGRGQCATIPWVSTETNLGDVWATDIELKYTSSVNSKYETATFSSFAPNKITFTEGEEACTLAFSGDCRSYIPAIGEQP